MREIPSGKPYERLEPHRRIEIAERKKVESLIRGPKGEVAKLSVAIASDGKARRINFWDLDKTLLRAHPMHMAAIRKLYPDIEDTADLETTFEAGWRLGTSIREFDRMHRIYREGQDQYRDPEVFKREILDDPEKLAAIEHPGHPEGRHERSLAMLKEYDQASVAAMDEIYASDPGYFASDEFIIRPMLHLLEMKSKLGELSVFMTANPRGLAEGLVRYGGLYKYGLTVAAEEDMIGGGKERAIKHLIDVIEKAEIPVPKNRLVVLGDSERGDVGSGYKVMQEGEYTFQGVLVRDTKDEVAVFKAAAASDPDLAKMLKEMDVTVVAAKEVPQREEGQFKMGRLGSAAAADQEKSSS